MPYITREDEQSLIEIVKNPESAMVDRRRVVEYLAHSFYGDEEGDRKLSEWEEDAPTCNISDIYDALLHNDLDKWEANFKYVPLSHPAASAWAVFKGMGERVQPNIVGGLNTRLQLFMTYKVRRVISNDNVAWQILARKKPHCSLSFPMITLHAAAFLSAFQFPVQRPERSFRCSWW